MEELHGAFENENIEQNADADYYYSRYRAALRARRKAKSPRAWLSAASARL